MASDIEEDFCTLINDAVSLLERVAQEQKGNKVNTPGISNWEELSEYLEQGMDNVAMTIRNADGTLKEIFFNNMEYDNKW